MGLETFTATVCNKILSGWKPCQNGAVIWRFTGVLCLHHQGVMLRDRLWKVAAQDYNAIFEVLTSRIWRGWALHYDVQTCMFLYVLVSAMFILLYFASVRKELWVWLPISVLFESTLLRSRNASNRCYWDRETCFIDIFEINVYHCESRSIWIRHAWILVWMKLHGMVRSS
jgi:hypothetical protein